MDAGEEGSSAYGDLRDLAGVVTALQAVPRTQQGVFMGVLVVMCGSGQGK